MWVIDADVAQGNKRLDYFFSKGLANVSQL